MDDSENQNNFPIQDLNLIDFSFEDDSLINFSGPLEPQFSENQEQKHVRFLDPFDSPNLETTFNCFEEEEQGSPAVGSSESEKIRSVKCNLRKSLAWDSAFFTSEGFLEPDELSTMIGVTEKNDKNVLPVIQEDVHRSTDSLSTLNSDTLTLHSLDGDIFDDVRASIQKSSKTSNLANSNNKKKVAESQTILSMKKVDLASRDKMTPKAALKNPSMLGSAKSIKQVSDRPQAPQEESTRSPHKPPKVATRRSAISTTSTKRASPGSHRINLEKDKSKSTSVRGAPAPKLPSRNVVPRPAPPSRSLHSLAATRMQVAASCSSLDSSGSGSSGSSGKDSSNSMKGKDSQNRSFSGSTVKSLPKTASRSKSQLESSHLTAYLRSAAKRSSSISPASSISEWSSESTSSTATAIHGPQSIRTSVHSSSSTRASVNSSAPQVMGSRNNSKIKCCDANDPKVPGLQGERVMGDSVGTAALLCPSSSKPSGLRMPSPKIGFFDGGRTAGCTPPGRLQSHSSLPSSLPRIGPASIRPSTATKKAKLSKSPTANSLSVQTTQQTASTQKVRPSLSFQAPSSGAVKVNCIAKNVKSPLVSPKFQSRISPKTSRERVLKAGEAASKVHDISTLENPHVLSYNMSPDSKGTADTVGAISNPMSKSLDAFGDLNSVCDAENVNPSQEVIKDAELCQLFPDNGLHSLTNANEKKGAHIEDQVNCLSRQVGAIHISIEKSVVSRSPESILTEGC